MARYWCSGIGYATLRDALDSRNSEELKELAKLFVKAPPARKGERIEVIERALAGEGLQRMWERLDTLSKSAVAERKRTGLTSDFT